MYKIDIFLILNQINFSIWKKNSSKKQLRKTDLSKTFIFCRLASFNKLDVSIKIKIKHHKLCPKRNFIEKIMIRLKVCCMAITRMTFISKSHILRQGNSEKKSGAKLPIYWNVSHLHWMNMISKPLRIYDFSTTKFGRNNYCFVYFQSYFKFEKLGILLLFYLCSAAGIINRKGNLI